jgi:hypothetical protein
MHESDDHPAAPDAAKDERPAPGGPYFGRLLIVLFAAVAFCAIITWVLSTTLPD